MNLRDIPTIDNIFFVAAIAILTLWLTLISSKGGLTDERFNGFFNKFTKRGWKAIKVGSFIGFVLILQEINNRSISAKKDYELSAEQTNRDSKITSGIKKGVDSSNTKLFDDLSIAFKKQGLRFDTIRKEIKRVRDSVKVVKNYGDMPLISVKNLKIIDSTNFDKLYEVEYQIISNDSQSLNLDLEFELIAYTYRSNFISFRNAFKISSKSLSLAKGEWFTHTLLISKNEALYQKYYFRLIGNYNSNNNNKKIKIDDIYVLVPRVKKNSFGLPDPYEEEIIRNYLKQKKID